MPDSTPRLGLINHGGFFSPYYLFEVLARQHGDELDPLGREANRRPLRRVYRKAEERLSAGSTASEAWSAWHRELLEALGFAGEALRRLELPIETARHGEVPISHGAYLPATDDGQQTIDDEILRGEGAQNDTPLVFIDCHGFGTDLDRDTYAASRTPRSEITEEPISRAIEFALDHTATRWAIVLAGSEMRLYRKGGSVARQYLQVNFAALFDADRADEWTAFWGLFRYAAFVPDAAPGAGGKCLLDRVLDESQRHASRIADDLRENVVLAVEAIMQGILDDLANHALVSSSTFVLSTLFEETLYFLYRLLFVLYAESRDLLPVGESLVYRDTYSLEHLRDRAEHPLPTDAGDHTYYSESIRTLFRLLQDGFPLPGSTVQAGFAIEPFNGQLFDPRRTALLDRCRIPDRALHTAIAELSLSRPRRRNDRRERFSYADLGVDQLGSIYEGLLVYEPAIVSEDTVLARVKGEERWLPRAQAEANGLDIVEGTLRRSGQFVLRLWGGRRKGSGSYYTPQEITSFLVKEALEPLASPIIEGCAAGSRRPDEILDLKVCDPAMGSGAFLIQACRYLAEAYGRARIAAGLDDDGRLSQTEFAAFKRLAAERCLYGVDLNPMAVELAKVSLWLETLARGRPLDFLDAHLRCGNSLIGAPLRDEAGQFSVERLLTIPEAALKDVSKEASREAKAAARARIKRNKEEIKRVQPQRAGQLGFGVDYGLLSLQAIESALNDYVTQRAMFERSDVDLPPGAAVALVHEKEQTFRRLQSDPAGAYVKVRLLCDLWCAVWFWLDADTVTRRQGEEVTSDEAITRSPDQLVTPSRPTTQLYLELISALLGTDEGSLTPDQREAYWRTVNAVWRDQRFFHWELEFPEVWREPNGKPKKHGGFDVIVGNPPWDALSPDTKEFYSNYEPRFTELTKKEARALVADLREDATISRAWMQYASRIQYQVHFVRESEMYEWFAPGNLGKGDQNLYRFFTERNFRLLRNRGNIGLVLPDGIYSGSNASRIRERLFEDSTAKLLFVFENRKGVFPHIDSRSKIALLLWQQGGYTDELPYKFLVAKDAAGNDLGPALEELPSLLNASANQAATMSISLIRQMAPDTLAVPELRSANDVRLATRLLKDFPRIMDLSSYGWETHFVAEFHMTNDSGLFNQSGVGRNNLPLLEGRMIHQFDHQFRAYESGTGRTAVWAELQFTGKRIKPQFYIDQSKIDDRRQHLPESFRPCFCAVTSATNERTMLSTMVPRKAVCNHSLATVWIDGAQHRRSLFWIGVANSFAFDWVIRLRASLNLTFTLVYDMPFPLVSEDDPRYGFIVQRALRSVCVTSETEQLWQEVIGQPWREADAASDPRERAQLRAEIDALVADLYGLSESDFAYILSTFPLLDRDWPALPGEPKSYITRDVALLELFKLRGKTPPEDIVAFHREAGVEIAAITGEVRSLAERVRLAVEAGAIAYVPSGRGAREEEVGDGEEVEDNEGE